MRVPKVALQPKHLERFTMNNMKIKRLLQCITAATTLLFASTTFATTFALPTNGNSMIGEVTYDTARSGDMLADIGYRHDIGIDEMRRANPGLSATAIVPTGRKIVIPGQFILPPVAREGIVINVAELRLYYYLPGQNSVFTAPIGIGREGGWQTPIGTTRITTKTENPHWVPTNNVRAEAARNGTPIPNSFPSGPNNPLGYYKMRLAWPNYLMHGTNRPAGVGSRVSAGCIRLFPSDIKHLFSMVAINTPVTVINQPFKAGWQNGQLYFEAHRPLIEDRPLYAQDMASVVNIVHQQTAKQNAAVQWSLVKNTAERPNGIPIVIGAK